jgi:O-methyltransferase involved in polyketide biosynthesis
LQAAGKAPTVYYEVDFPDVLAEKVEVLKKAKDMQALLEIDEECLNGGDFSGEIHTPSYHLIAGDLRDVAALEASLKAADLDPSLPTLILAECVLIYMTASETTPLVQWSGTTFSCAAFVTYEQVIPPCIPTLVHNHHASTLVLITTMHPPSSS